MNTNINKDNVLKTFLKYSIPCVIGMFLTSFITVVDGMFIGWKIGERGLAAVNLTLPILYLLLGITIMVGVGGSTLALQSLGEKNQANANQRFTLTLVLNVVVNMVIIIIVGLAMNKILYFLNARNELYYYVKDYLGTMIFFYIFMMMNITLAMFIRGEGKPQLSLLFGIVANVLNIFLDYLLIIRMDLGMRGAALASGLSVLLAFTLGALYFLTGKSLFKLTKITFNTEDIKNTLYNGSSEFIGQMALAITTYLFNFVIIRRIGVNGVAALTIVGYISMIQYMILTGIAQGIHPLISYSFGAKDRDTIFKVLSIGSKAVFVVGAVTLVLSFAATEGIIRVFSRGNSELINIAKYGLRIYSIAFIINGFNIVASTYFTSIGDAKISGIISLLRSLVLISMFIFTLPHIIGDTGIWLTTPLAEAVTFVVSYTYIRKSKMSAGATVFGFGKFIC
ncbi:putative efflux protein, MATE family [Natronincola peptidivorans]|uniref:Multidrug export protein MepA n=1 Tax=Natronincola peptidivorans TaxID=426128 RepID=A0A1I0AXU2_9FIRM|nr:MATE family efflux transporter [Natronincola peptidivorans]SES99251.1 putative efflux protein, MATE family [Natronincola peptidivorans]